MRGIISAGNLPTVSYLPYQPEVWPPEPVDEPRNRAKVIWWICGVLVYFLMIAGWVYWMKLPPKPKAPIAMIAMPNGTELRLVHVSVGKNSGIHHGATFDGRLPARDNNLPHQGATDNLGGLWLVFSDYQPATQRFTAPERFTLEIMEPGSPYPLRPSRLDASNGPCLTALFHAVPTDLRDLNLRITRRGTTVQASIRNPLYQANPINPVPPNDGTEAQPLPQQKESGGFTARFEKVTFRETANPALDKPKVKAEAHFRVTHVHAPPGSFYQSYEWFDTSGNVVQSGVLPWSSKVWGLRLNVQETDSFPVPSNRLFVLGTVKAPGPNQVVTLPVPPQMKRTVSDIFVIGTGTYTWSGGNLLPSGSSKAVATASGNPRYGSISESAWGIYLLSTGRHSQNEPSQPKVRVRKGDVICHSGSSGSSAWNNFRQQHFSHYRLPKGESVPAGDEVSIEAVTPKMHRFEFTIPRPEYSPTPAK